MLWWALAPHMPHTQSYAAQGPEGKGSVSWKCWELQSKLSHGVMDDSAFSLFTVVGMCSLYTGYWKGQQTKTAPNTLVFAESTASFGVGYY